MNRKQRHQNIYFRITGLTDQQLNLFKENVVSVPRLDVGKYFKNRTLFVASFKIRKDKTYDDLCKFLKTHKIPESLYGLYISVLTSKSIDGVKVPDYVLKLYKKTGGTIDVFYDAS